MKTIAQIAREIGVSKQAIHNKIKKEPLKSNLRGMTKTIDNALQIDVDGESLIKSAFNENSVDASSIKINFRGLTNKTRIYNDKEN